MKKCFLFLSLFGSFVFFYGCQKELSLETSKNPSQGTLQSEATGECLPKVIAGTYEKGKPLDGTVNYIEVQVDVIKPGSYTIYSDTVNGIYFRGTGIFTSTGLTTVRLKGNGTPLAEGISNFLVTYGITECLVSVTIFPVGGPVPAVFTLAGTPGSCLNFVLSGTYVKGVLLNNSNNVVINVNVTTPGTYNIVTQVSNGIVFSGSGTLNSGAQTITLTAAGSTPASQGIANIPVSAGSSSCSFTIDVVGPAAFSVDCNSANVLGSYEEGVALDASNKVEIDVNVTVTGGYSISGNINGMTFSDAGNFSATGIQTIILQGSGTPATDGIFNVPVTGASTGCNFEVTVDPASVPAATGSWQFTQGSTTYQGTVLEADFDPVAPGALYFYFYGQSATGDFVIEMFDISGSIQANEIYSMSSTAGNAGTFYFVSSSAEYSADPSIATNTVTAKITSHNTATKTMIGTFSGKAEDANGVLRDITNGSFTVIYQ